MNKSMHGNKNRRLPKRSAALIVILVMLLSLSFTVFAGDAAQFDPERKGSISVTLQDSESKKSVDGAVLVLYRVAGISDSKGSVGYETVGDFTDFDLENYNISDNKTVASALMNYVTENGLTGEKKTTEGGKLVFSDLIPGLYFITEEGSVEGYYPVVPFIVTVPMMNEAGDGWIYDVDASPKVELEPKKPGEFIDIDVLKAWVNVQSDSIPETVKVALLCDGAFFEQVTLKKSEGWKYTWKSLPKDKKWSVCEVDVPAGFIASYSQSGNKFTVTNKPSSPPIILGVQANHIIFYAIAFAADIAIIIFLIVFFRKRRKNR